MTSQSVNSYRFTGSITRRLLETWIKQAPGGPIPWTPLPKPLSQCTVALLSSGGIALKSGRPFDQEGERRNPWWGDPSFRIIPSTAREQDIEVYHLHINPDFARRDLNCLLPIQRLAELQAAGEVGRLPRRITRSWATFPGRTRCWPAASRLSFSI